jgi:NarL family two-component system response regulator LiaR
VSEDPILVMIADDDPLARGVLRRALADEAIEVVAETASALEATQLAKTHHPDLILMDPALGPQDGVAAIRSVLSANPGGRILVLANESDPQLAMNCLRAGASGYITRDIDPAVLPRLVRAVMAGEAAVSRELTMSIVEHLRELPDNNVGVRPVKSPLTPREWEVLDLLCLNHSTDEIAQELFVTGETARSHVKNILRKLGARSRAEAVQAAAGLRRAST